MDFKSIIILFAIIGFAIVDATDQAATVTVLNNCSFIVWPLVLTDVGKAHSSTRGFPLRPSESKPFSVSPTWSGRLWARTDCSKDPTTGKFSCLTGDCGSGAVSPATLAEFNLAAGSGSMDFYGVTLVDGYNLPISVAPVNGWGGNCLVAGCEAELNDTCPAELRVASKDGGKTVACRSACQNPRSCYSTAGNGTENTCKPTVHSEFFKNACPRAYSDKYDDVVGTGMFSCSSANYIVTFCPSPFPSLKSAPAKARSSKVSIAKWTVIGILVVVFVVLAAVFVVLAAAWNFCVNLH